jgi:hypothetical protein
MWYSLKLVTTRRDVLKLALGTSVWMAAGCPRPRPVATGPRYWILMMLSGGHDTLYTTDPKTADEVDDLVTLPNENTIARAGDLRFGAHFAKLERWASRLAVLNGVQVRTANHETGQAQFVHLKTNVAERMPTALDAIAMHRGDQPLGVVYLNLFHRVMHSPAYIGTADRFYYGEGDLFEYAARARPDELVELARTLRRQAANAGGTRAGEQTAIYAREVADYFERVATVPALELRERSTDYVTQSMAESLERALWLIEHDLCCGIVIDLGLLGWDTHIRNDSKQHEMNGNFATFFDEYLAALDARSNRHGTLASRTVTVVG